MDDSRLTQWWQSILEKDPAYLEDARLPLLGLEQYLVYLNLPPLPPLKFSLDPGSRRGMPDPGFENLTEQILVYLRGCVYSHQDTVTLALWAEKLMRFCEVRYSVLRARAVKKWGSQDISKLNILQLAAFLLDYGLSTRDLRFVNTLLKLGDLKWLINEPAIQKGLEQREEQFLSALFQVRIVLMMKYAIQRIQRGEPL